ncbi:histidine phosphotransferase, partial [Thioclava sp. BHET1]
PYGGKITITREAEGGWEAEARSDRLRSDPTLWSRLSGAEAWEIDAAKVQFALAAQELQAQGRSLSLSQSEGEMRLRW